MLLEHGCLDLMCQPQMLLKFWTSEPQVAYKMLAYIKKMCIFKKIRMCSELFRELFRSISGKCQGKRSWNFGRHPECKYQHFLYVYTLFL